MLCEICGRPASVAVELPDESGERYLCLTHAHDLMTGKDVSSS
jgi:hypothetical protein